MCQLCYQMREAGLRLLCVTWGELNSSLQSKAAWCAKPPHHWAEAALAVKVNFSPFPLLLGFGTSRWFGKGRGGEREESAKWKPFLQPDLLLDYSQRESESESASKAAAACHGFAYMLRKEGPLRVFGVVLLGCSPCSDLFIWTVSGSFFSFWGRRLGCRWHTLLAHPPPSRSPFIHPASLHSGRGERNYTHSDISPRFFPGAATPRAEANEGASLRPSEKKEERLYLCGKVKQRSRKTETLWTTRADQARGGRGRLSSFFSILQGGGDK